MVEIGEVSCGFKLDTSILYKFNVGGNWIDGRFYGS